MQKSYENHIKSYEKLSQWAYLSQKDPGPGPCPGGWVGLGHGEVRVAPGRVDPQIIIIIVIVIIIIIIISILGDLSNFGGRPPPLFFTLGPNFSNGPKGLHGPMTNTMWKRFPNVTFPGYHKNPKCRATPEFPNVVCLFDMVFIRIYVAFIWFYIVF